MEILEYKRKKIIAYILLGAGATVGLGAYFFGDNISNLESTEVQLAQWAMWGMYAVALTLITLGTRYIRDNSPMLTISPQGIRVNDAQLRKYGVVSWKDITSTRLRIQKNKNNKTYFAMLVLADDFYHARNIPIPSGWRHRINTMLVGEGIAVGLSFLEGEAESIYKKIEEYHNKYK